MSFTIKQTRNQCINLINILPANECNYFLIVFSLALVFELQLWPEIPLFSQLNIGTLFSEVVNTLSRCHNSHTKMKSRDRLSSLQVFVTWSVKLLPVNSLHFLLSGVQKQLYCRWCPQVLSWELCHVSFSWPSTLIDCVVYL